MKRSAWTFEFKNRTNGFCNFQSYHEVVMVIQHISQKMYAILKINRNNIFELTYYK